MTTILIDNTEKQFHEVYNMDNTTMNQIDSRSAMYLPVGEVILVRSANVPDLGDHYIIITGEPVLKPHGLRPKTITIKAPMANDVLNDYLPMNGLVLLQLSDTARDAFFKHYGLSISKDLKNCGAVTFTN